jgi:hypothetical protein
MKRLVAELPVGPYVVPVFECDEKIEVDGAECDGALHADPIQILISARLHGAARWVTILHELVHARTVLLDLPEAEAEEATCTVTAAIIVQALGRYLGPPPGDRPPRWPEPLPDDETTPTVPIMPITRKEQMP